MSTLPLLVVLAGALGAGAFNLWGWLRGARKPVWIAAHLLLGVGAAEALVAALHGSGLADDDPLRHTAKLALLFLAGAVFTGFGAPLLRKSGLANAVLAAHVCAGLAAFFLALSLGTRL